MKKIVTFVLISLICCVVVTAVAGCTKTDTPDNADIAGGYSEDRKPDADDLALFETMTAELTGVSYEPTLVATQVVAGTNYRFTSTATVVAPGAKPRTVYVYIYKPLSGEPELTEIVEID